MTHMSHTGTPSASPYQTHPPYWAYWTYQPYRLLIYYKFCDILLIKYSRHVGTANKYGTTIA